MSWDVLVAGIGNVFLSDDGFGVEVASQLSRRSMPPGVRVADFGIRGVHLAYELLEGCGALVLVDAVPMGEDPGTLAVLAPDAVGPAGGGEGAPVMDAHTMGPEAVLGTLAHLGGHVERVLVVGCEPASVDEGMGLTPPVAAAVGTAVEMCRQLVDEMLQQTGTEARR